MKLLIHLCRKDYSFAKHTLWGAWAVFLVAVLMPVIMTGPLVNAVALFLVLVSFAPLLLIFAATLRILSADSFTGGHAFIGTRPVTMTMLWLSKLITIAAFVLLPWLLAQIIGVFALGLHLTPADWMLFLIEKKLLFGIAMAIPLMVGTHTRNFGWTTLLTITFTILMIRFATTTLGKPGGLDFIMEARYLRASQWLVTQLLISIAALLLSWLWMVRRNLSWSIAVGLIAIAGIAIVSTNWQVNFVEKLAFSKAPAAPNLCITWLDGPSISGSSRNHVQFTRVIRDAKLEGVPDGWIASFSGIRANAHFHNGGVMTGDTINSRKYGDFSRALLPALGVDLPMNHPDRLNQWNFITWFEAESSLLRDRPDPVATISGTCMVELDQPVVLANLPARNGASASNGRFLYRVESVEPSGSSISVKLTVCGATLGSRGDWSDILRGIEILLINPKIGKQTQSQWSGGSTSGLGWASLRRDLSIDDWPNSGTSDPLAFLNGARLYVIGRRHGGTVPLPFDIPEIRLEKNGL